MTVSADRKRQRTASPSRKHKGPQVLFVALLLTACKGGGDTAFNYSSPYSPPAPVLNTVLTAVSSFVPSSLVASFDGIADTLLTTDVRYTNQIYSNWSIVLDDGSTVSGLNTNPLRHSGVAFAHAAGLTGVGQTVVLADTHINENHEVFSGKPGGTVSLATSNTALGADKGENDHGTTVAAIIGGQSSSFIGVAPGANIIFGAYTTDQTLTAATNAAINSNAVAMNNSWGYDSTFVSTDSYQIIFSGVSGQTYLNALRNYANQGVVVFAVSNNTAHTHSTIMDALPYVDPSFEAGWLAVANGVPSFSGGNISSVQLLSAGCYEAARWCLVADGTWAHGPSATDGSNVASNTNYDWGTGSSFAAPQVSGALALLAEAFPQLSPHDLRVRLMASANNKFFTPDDTVELVAGFNKGYSFTYGLGYLDVRAALQPIGPTAMALANGSTLSADLPILQSGSAMGDAVATSLSRIDVAVTDSLNAGFNLKGGSLASSSAPTPLATSLLSKALTRDLASLRTDASGAIADPFAAFNAPTLAVNDPYGDFAATVLLSTPGDDTFGLSVKRALIDGPTKLELGVKVARDGGAVIGFGGNNGEAASSLAALQLGLTQDLGEGGFLSLSGELGLADLGSQAALSNVSSAGFNSVKLDIGSHGVFTDNDRLAFGVSLPMAVTSGSAEMILPVAHSSGISFDPVQLDLAPSDRQVDLALSYQREILPGLEMTMQLVHAENYGNRAGETDTAGVWALKYAF